MSNSPERRPVIGLTTYGRKKDGNFFLPAEYLDSVRQAGGLPVLLTPGEAQVEQLYDLVDGFIFSGGGDLDPALYGGSKHPLVSAVDPERDTFETALLKIVLKREKPALGICRGLQLFTIATGGTLIEHVPDRVEGGVVHRTESGDKSNHEVAIEKRGQLADIFGETRLTVVSKHHQAPATVTEDWDITARAADGVVEALELKGDPTKIAVLWHPELSPGDVSQEKLFGWIVRLSAKQN